jgi:signal transduction histidine kinase
MRRRSRADGERAESRDKTATPKRRSAPESVGAYDSSVAGQETEVARLTRERDEALEQQRATADVLKIISASPTELQPVLDAVVRSAARLCDADDVTIFEQDGQDLRRAAHWGPLTHLDIGFRFPCTHGSVAGRTVLERSPIHVIDLQAETEDFPEGSAIARRLGHRTTAGVPLLREGVALGTIQVRRGEVKPFTEKQIALLETFAAQAVIAIESTRLLNELRQRTEDLTESLEQQTATSEILEVISNSPTDTQPAFDAIVHSGLNLFPDAVVTISLPDCDLVKLGAIAGADEAGVEALRGRFPLPLTHEFITGTAILDRREIDLADAYEPPKELTAGAQNLLAGGYTAMTVVPMVRGDETIGTLNVVRRHPGPLSDKQRELLRTFAKQAVIAIENTRLFNELRESLDNLRTTQDRLVQTQKLALLGQLTAGIAHEIKNPLNFVNNFSGISAELIDELRDTLKDVSLDDKARTEINELTGTLKSNFDKVLHHGRRADAIVKNMLQHSREGSGEHRVIDINTLVEESLNLAWHGARAETQGFEIKVKQSFDPSAGGVDVFPQDIRRALLNMISNGFYAATRRRAEINGGDYEPTLTASTKSLGERVEIRIRDNGTGMTADVKEKMFNPFFTTKPTGEGTGLGLSISHDIIVKQHGGSIDVASQPGEFTEIKVILPRVAVFV